MRTEEHQKELEKQNAALKAQDEALKKQQEQLAEEQKRVQPTKLQSTLPLRASDSWMINYIFDEVTVYFGNGKTNIEAEYKPKLMQFAEKARTVQGYMVQVIDYASSTGSEELNQKLSEDRAHNVTILLSRRGQIPLMNMLAPGAMGESRPGRKLEFGRRAGRKSAGRRESSAEQGNRRMFGCRSMIAGTLCFNCVAIMCCRSHRLSSRDYRKMQCSSPT